MSSTSRQNIPKILLREKLKFGLATLPSSSESSSNNYPPTTDHDDTAGPELLISKDQAE